MSSKLCFLICGYFAREAKAALAAIKEPDDDIEVVSFTPECGRPILSWQQVDELVKDGSSNSEVVVLGSVCLEQKAPPNPQKYLLHFDQCFHMICPPAIVDHALAEGAYLLSPGWLAGWHKKTDQWGFDQVGAQSFLGESCSKLLLLDTGVDTNSQKQLEAFAEYIDRPAERLPIGLDYLQSILEHQIARWRENRLQKKIQDESKHSSGYAMSLDLLANLTHSASESEAIDGILQLFNMLFAPADLLFIPYHNNEAGKVRYFENTKGRTEHQFQPFDGSYQWCDGERGFWLKLERSNETLGFLKMDQVAFPEYRHAYLNQSLNIIGLCALVIDNARTRRKLVDAAHMAGKAELAIDVLHNVGNILNSINICSQSIYQGIAKSASHRLPSIVGIMDEHSDNLGAFITNDPRGGKLLDYFKLLSQELEKEQKGWLVDLDRLGKNLDHIKGIIRTQQIHSRHGVLLERVAVDELLDETLGLFSDKINRYGIVLDKHYDYQGEFQLAKHKLLQVLSNLIGNAIDALTPIQEHTRKLALTIEQKPKQVTIEIKDNGIGIPRENLVRIFHYGFTTKPNHSGIGLHSCANYATELGGELTVHSNGADRGASFRLNFPTTSVNEEKPHDA